MAFIRNILLASVIVLCSACVDAEPESAPDTEPVSGREVEHEPITEGGETAADRMAFWATPQSGANSFLQSPPDEIYFRALADTGATWVRLTFSKWTAAERDFLIGDADGYTAIPEDDLATLTGVLDAAHSAGIGVVLTPLSLPGSRWRQQNDGEFDDRLWSDTSWWDQSARFWADTANALDGHPAIVGYNILNEPAPERTQDVAENAAIADNRAFMAAQEGTARDLIGFYETVIAAIRQVDPDTPIMVDAGYYGNPRNLAAWPKPLSDERVLYAFHMYEPYEATGPPNRRRDTPLRYPGAESSYGGGTVAWDAEVVTSHIGNAFDWADANGLPPQRVVAGEFGCIRTWEDCGTYLTDVVDAVIARDGHWAYYEFRPDDWEAMDYEIPADFPQGRYYWLMEEGRDDEIPRDGQLFDILEQRSNP